MAIEAKFYVKRGEFILDVALSIDEKGITALFGPSGSGKTTLLRAIAGLEHHRNGFLKVGDQQWQQDSFFVPPHRRRIGYVFQEASLFTHLTVRGNVEYGYGRVPESERKIPLDSAIELLAIKHLLNRKVDTLSGGERQRVAIARALAISPCLLLMDEPLAALDTTSKQEIFPYLESLYDQLEIPVIYVSHTAEEIARLADYLILLKAGKVVATGGIDEMLTRLDLPTTHGNDAAAIIPATVVGYDEQYHLAHLDFGGGCLMVARKNLQIKQQVRVRLAACDVSLTLERQSATSILNIFPVKVDEMMAEGEAQVTVRLLAGKVPILSRITKKSAIELDLQPGKVVYAQVKSVSLLN